MSNTYLSISMITREMLMVLENNLTFGKHISREYDDRFGKEGAKIGNTLNIRKPSRFLGRTGQTISIENYVEQSVPLVLSTQFGVDATWTSADMELNMDDFSERFVVPAAAAIANKIDRDGLTLAAQSVYNTVGTPGTTPSTLQPYLQAGAKMDFMGAPRDNQRALCIDPLSQASVVYSLQGLFHSASEIEEQYKSGNMGMSAGFKWSMDQNVISQTIGTYSGTPVVSGGGQTGNSLVTGGWGNSLSTLLNVGDVFTIAGVYAVNPQSRQSTGQLAQFVVTATASSNGSGASTISISPSIIPSGQYQNVTASPANSAAITVYGASGTVTPTSIAYHKNAFTLGCADLPLPGGVDKAARVADKKLGLSIRLVRAYDITNDLFPCRLDVLYGYAALYPELACRIQG